MIETVCRWIPRENEVFLPKNKHKILKIERHRILCELDRHWVQHRHQKYDRLFKKGLLIWPMKKK